MVETLHQLYHDSPMAGHVRIHETLYRVSEHCFIKRMDPIFTECVRLCPDCQKCKITNHHTTAYSTPCTPFEVWQMNLVGPLPISPQGFSYVLTAVDMFSKYLISIPLANKEQ
jgi:hypothetical protein